MRPSLFLRKSFGPQGFEPWTSCTRNKRTTKLRYGPISLSYLTRPVRQGRGRAALLLDRFWIQACRSGRAGCPNRPMENFHLFSRRSDDRDGRPYQALLLSPISHLRSPISDSPFNLNLNKVSVHLHVHVHEQLPASGQFLRPSNRRNRRLLRQRSQPRLHRLQSRLRRPARVS